MSLSAGQCDSWLRGSIEVKHNINKRSNESPLDLTDIQKVLLRYYRMNIKMTLLSEERTTAQL